jgi:nucleotide-binding universal stress UspA family protein
MVNKILIPTDFSDSTIEGIRYVAAQLAVHPIHCYLLHIVEHSASRALYSADTETPAHTESVEQVLRKLDRMVDGFTLPAGMTIEPVVRYGEPWKEILRFTEGEKVDLIVAAADSASDAPTVLSGKVSDLIARYSPVPVLMLKPGTFADPPVSWEEIREQVHFQYDRHLEPNR